MNPPNRSNPVVQLSKINDAITAAAKQNENIITFLTQASDKELDLVHLFVFISNAAPPLDKFWSVEKSHVHMSYKIFPLPNQTLGKVMIPATLTMRAPGQSEWKPTVYVQPFEKFQVSMNNPLPEGGTPFTSLVQEFRTHRDLRVSEPYQSLTPQQVKDLGKQWDDVLAAVQQMMNAIYTYPWDLS